MSAMTHSLRCDSVCACSTRAAVHYAAMNGNVDILEMLLDHGGDVNEGDCRGLRPLHYACAEGHLSAVNFLLQCAHCLVNATASDGITGLHLASANGHLDVVKLLLAHGADPMQRNAEGHTSLDLACIYRQMTVANYLHQRLQHPHDPTTNFLRSHTVVPRSLSFKGPPMQLRASVGPGGGGGGPGGAAGPTGGPMDHLATSCSMNSVLSNPMSQQFQQQPGGHHPTNTSSSIQSHFPLLGQSQQHLGLTPTNHNHHHMPRMLMTVRQPDLEFRSISSTQQLLRPRQTSCFVEWPSCATPAVGGGGVVVPPSTPLSYSHAPHIHQHPSLSSSSSTSSLTTSTSAVTTTTTSGGSGGGGGGVSWYGQRVHDDISLISSSASHTPTTQRPPTLTAANQSVFVPPSVSVDDLQQNLRDACFAVQARALQGYQNVQITFKEGDLITVLRQHDNNWWKGYVTSQGIAKTGLFPSIFVQLLDNSRLPLLHATSSTPTSPGYDGSGPGTPTLPCYRSYVAEEGEEEAEEEENEGDDDEDDDDDDDDEDCLPIAMEDEEEAAAAAIAMATIAATTTGGGAVTTAGGERENLLLPPSMAPMNRDISSSLSSSSSTNNCCRCNCHHGGGVQPINNAAAPGGTTTTTAAVGNNSSSHQRHSGASWDSGRGSAYAGSIVDTIVVSSVNNSTINKTQSTATNNTKDVDLIRCLLQTAGLSHHLERVLSAGYDLYALSRATPEDLTGLGITSPQERTHLKATFQRIGSLPDPLPNFIPSQLSQLLSCVQLGDYEKLLFNQGCKSPIDLMRLSWEDLTEMGVKKLGHLKKFSLLIERLKRMMNAQDSQRDLMRTICNGGGGDCRSLLIDSPNSITPSSATSSNNSLEPFDLMDSVNVCRRINTNPAAAAAAASVPLPATHTDDWITTTNRYPGIGPNHSSTDMAMLDMISMLEQLEKKLEISSSEKEQRVQNGKV